jgi:hypothetical protein
MEPTPFWTGPCQSSCPVGALPRRFGPPCARTSPDEPEVLVAADDHVVVAERAGERRPADAAAIACCASATVVACQLSDTGVVP